MITARKNFEKSRVHEAALVWGKLVDSLAKAYDYNVYAHHNKSWDSLRVGDEILIIRKYGGLGDVINASVIARYVAEEFPQNLVTFCTPLEYHELFRGYHDIELLDYNACAKPDPKIRSGVIDPAILSKYAIVEDVSTPCHVWEQVFTRLDTTRHFNWRNRADIWANHIGLRLTDPRSCLTIPSAVASAARTKYFGDCDYACALCPTSANALKDWTDYQQIIPSLTKMGWRVTVFSDRIPTAVKVPSNLELAAAIAAADLCITVDSAPLHIAGTLRVPTICLFGINDGKAYCKYYQTVTPLQFCKNPCIMYHTDTCKQRLQRRDCYGLGSAAKVLQAIESDPNLKIGG